ncbi:MAG TPA: sugar phosphate isomerase/epimerase [Armatimonadota bacterium]|jgi:sugar phosphate isomerase/epimerase
MTKQNFEIKNDEIQAQFEIRRAGEGLGDARLNLSWSNWGFGVEPLAVSAARLQKAGLEFIELHGNHYGPHLGYEPEATLRILGDHGLRVSGVCGMFSADNDLSSNRPVQRQNALDYLRREIAFTQAVGGTYLLVVPGAVGRATPYDDMEFHRSVETLRMVAEEFVAHHVRAAVEPIRSAEVSFVHTIAEAKDYIHEVGHPGVAHINGDVYHMQSEESHLGEALLEAGGRLTNLHLADSNRCALGEGSMDYDTIIRALYVLGYNTDGRFLSFEPLGPGGDPYPAMYGRPDPARLDALVNQSVRYFREREEAVREG